MNEYTQVLFKNRRPNETVLLPEYEKSGGYQGLRAALKMSPAEVCGQTAGARGSIERLLQQPPVIDRA